MDASLSNLPKDTWAADEKKPGIEPPTFQSADDLLYFFSYNYETSKV